MKTWIFFFNSVFYNNLTLKRGKIKFTKGFKKDKKSLKLIKTKINLLSFTYPKLPTKHSRHKKIFLNSATNISTSKSFLVQLTKAYRIAKSFFKYQQRGKTSTYYNYNSAFDIQRNLQKTRKENTLAHFSRSLKSHKLNLRGRTKRGSAQSYYPAYVKNYSNPVIKRGEYSRPKNCNVLTFLPRYVKFKQTFIVRMPSNIKLEYKSITTKEKLLSYPPQVLPALVNNRYDYHAKLPTNNFRWQPTFIYSKHTSPFILTSPGLILPSQFKFKPNIGYLYRIKKK